MVLAAATVVVLVGAAGEEGAAAGTDVVVFVDADVFNNIGEMLKSKLKTMVRIEKVVNI